MHDISDFHPLIQEAMRTGRMPSDAEIAGATRRTTEEVSRALGETADEDEANGTEPVVTDPPDPDEQRFRDKYHQLVDAMTAEWLDEHLEYGKRVPAGVRERIEDDCNRVIQHAWRLHRQRLVAEQGTDL